MTELVHVQVNGAERALPAGSSLTDLVRALGFSIEQVAIERNQGLVRRSEFARTTLQEGDRLEVVTLVGGG